MKALLPALLLAVAATIAHADCTPPNMDIKIPDGNTATKEELLAAKKAIQDNDTTFQMFAQCLKNAQDAEIAAGGADMKDEDKTKIATRYTNRQNEEADKLQKLADRLNAEIRNYKAKHAAESGTPAAPPASR